MTTFPPTPTPDVLAGPTQMLPLRIPGATLHPDPDTLLPVPAGALLDEVDALLFADIAARLGDPTTGPTNQPASHDNGCRCGQPQPGVRAVGRARTRQAKAKQRGKARRTRRR
ncbi:hypothetical protein ABZ671_18985 [Micromonospora sp. NPDC006766]|uniref:hypothetical protein n=1 Tax=Micromonospora sp. NPDC006766 TaxID=3154778 RepID=UPI0033DED58B